MDSSQREILEQSSNKKHRRPKNRYKGYEDIELGEHGYLYDKNEFELIKFMKDPLAYRKYIAVIKHKKKEYLIGVPFSTIGARIYKDRTGLGLYPTLETNDENIKWEYSWRVIPDDHYSSLYFAKYYLYS